MILFLLAYALPAVYLETPDFREPILPEEVFVGDRGEVYIQNTSECYLAHFDALGKRQKNMGGKGKGPGEFSSLVHTSLFENRLYVCDIDRIIHIFEGDGRFVESIDVPSVWGWPLKTKNGFVFIEASYTRQGWRLFKLVLADNSFENKKISFQWRSRSKKGGRQEVFVDPAPDRPRLAVDKEGRRVFFYQPGSAAVHIIDVSSRKIVRKIETLKRLPFDKGWGGPAYREIKNQMAIRAQNMSRPLRFMPSYPDYFPAIKSMRIGPKNNLMVWDAGHFMKREDPPRIFTRSGIEIEYPYSPRVPARLIAVREDTAWVTLFDKQTETAGVARVALTELEDFIARHPIDH